MEMDSLEIKRTSDELKFTLKNVDVNISDAYRRLPTTVSFTSELL